MSDSKPFRFFEILLVLLSVAYAILSVWAAFLALQQWIGIWWSIPPIFGLGLLLRGIRLPIVAIFGAIQVLAWPWWIAVLVFLPALPILILLTPLVALRREVIFSCQKRQSYR